MRGQPSACGCPATALAAERAPPTWPAGAGRQGGMALLRPVAAQYSAHSRQQPPTGDEPRRLAHAKAQQQAHQQHNARGLRCSRPQAAAWAASVRACQAPCASSAAALRPLGVPCRALLPPPPPPHTSSRTSGSMVCASSSSQSGTTSVLGARLSRLVRKTVKLRPCSTAARGGGEGSSAARRGAARVRPESLGEEGRASRAGSACGHAGLHAAAPVATRSTFTHTHLRRHAQRIL